MICVVVPYFQRASGVLRRALASVAKQRDCGLPVHVVVVDDGSPVPAGAEVDAAQLPSTTTLQVIRQANAGPGAARNTALAAAPAATRYIAFLDSDDEWRDDHLKRGVIALEQGFDFYFSDLYQLDQSVGAFARAGRITPGDHPALPGADHLHAYQGDMFDQIIRGNVIGTPTVIFRHAGFASHRFRTDLTSAGEDYLFWMTLVKAGVRIVFSSEVEVTCGRGVNVYAGAAWASDEFFVRVRHEVAFKKSVELMFPTSPAQRSHLQQSIRQLRDQFAGAWLHRVRHRRPKKLDMLRAQLRADPASLAAIPKFVLRSAFGRR